MYQELQDPEVELGLGDQLDPQDSWEQRAPEAVTGQLGCLVRQDRLGPPALRVPKAGTEEPDQQGVLVELARLER